MPYKEQPEVIEAPKNIEDLSGRRFSRLMVVGFSPESRRQSKWVCICDCGMHTISFGFCLKSGKSLSCGCLAKERAIAFWDTEGGRIERIRRSTESKNASHRKSKHPLYGVWSDIKGRCLNKNHKWFSWYGERGISICDEWMDFQRFYDDMIYGWEIGLQIGRIDNDLGYSKLNCRWETPKQQQRNKTNTRYVITPKGRMSLADAADEYGLKSGCIIYRISAGWEMDKVYSKKSQRDKN